MIRDEEIVFKNRIQSRTWPIFPGTKHQTEVKIGDMLIFYQGGLNGQIFLGTAKITSELKSIPGKIDDIFEIDDIVLWKKPPSIRDMLSKLQFIKNKTSWGLNLQGGILKPTNNDFNLILDRAEKINVKKQKIKKQI